MHILVYSRVFPPSVGGTEEVVRLLAEQFAASGHATTVATETQASVAAPHSYAVVRRPGSLGLFRLARRADVCLTIGVSLRAVPWVLLARCPLVVSHHIYPEKHAAEPFRTRWRSRIKYAAKCKVSSFAPKIYPSRALRDAMSGDGCVIPNPFDASRFRCRGEPRDRDVVFAGRMIPEKGCLDLIDAVELLASRGIGLSVTLIGDGPEQLALQRTVRERGLESSIHFTGRLTGAFLASALARHKLLVVPSRCPEAFGIVALEGMASGCAILGTNVGGLPEAIGTGGLVVPPADISAMADAMQGLLQDENLWTQFSRAGIAQAADHAPSAVAREYLDVLESAIPSPNQQPHTARGPGKTGSKNAAE